jgi:hypothetical protein
VGGGEGLGLGGVPGSPRTMNAEQRVHFLSKGWIVVPDVMSPRLIAELTEIYDAHLDGSASAHPEDTAWDGQSFTHRWYNTGQQRPREERHGRPRVLWGKPYYELINLPALVPILAELLSDAQYGHCAPGAPSEHAQKYRLDHDNTHFAAPFDPHTNDVARDRDSYGGVDFKNKNTQRHMWTPDGIKIGSIHGGDPIKTRTVSVIMELGPIEPGRGGTACISGTHRPGCDRPDGARGSFPPWPEEYGVEVRARTHTRRQGTRSSW